MSARDLTVAYRRRVTHPHRCERDVRFSGHVHDLITVIRILIAVSCPRTTSCRHVVILWRTRAAVSATFILASHAQRHLRDLIAFVRILIAASCPRMTLRRRVAMLWRTRTAVSVTCVAASRVQRRVRDSIAIVRILIAVSCPRTTSCRRVAILWRTRSATFMDAGAVRSLFHSCNHTNPRTLTIIQ